MRLKDRKNILALLIPFFCVYPRCLQTGTIYLYSVYDNIFVPADIILIQNNTLYVVDTRWSKTNKALTHSSIWKGIMANLKLLVISGLNCV